MTILKYALAGLVLLGGINTFAQEDKKVETKTELKNDKTPEERADKKVAKLTEKLSLTEAQAASTKTLLLEMITNIQAMKADETLTKETKKAKVKSMKENFKTDLEALLDDSQKEKLAEIEAEHKAKIAEKKAQKKKTYTERAAALTDEMTEALSLTPEQVEKVRVLNLKVADKIHVIKNDESMTKEKKKEFIKGNKADHLNVMSTILTDDQMVTYEAWMAEKKAERKDKKATKKEIKVSE